MTEQEIYAKMAESAGRLQRIADKINYHNNLQ